MFHIVESTQKNSKRNSPRITGIRKSGFNVWPRDRGRGPR